MTKPEKNTPPIILPATSATQGAPDASSVVASLVGPPDTRSGPTSDDLDRLAVTAPPAVAETQAAPQPSMAAVAQPIAAAGETVRKLAELATPPTPSPEPKRARASASAIERPAPTPAPTAPPAPRVVPAGEVLLGGSMVLTTGTVIAVRVAVQFPALTVAEQREVEQSRIPLHDLSVVNERRHTAPVPAPAPASAPNVAQRVGAQQRPQTAPRVGALPLLNTPDNRERGKYTAGSLLPRASHDT